MIPEHSPFPWHYEPGLVSRVVAANGATVAVPSTQRPGGRWLSKEEEDATGYALSLLPLFLQWVDAQVRPDRLVYVGTNDDARPTIWAELADTNRDDPAVPEWRARLAMNGYALLGGGAAPRSALWVDTTDDPDAPCDCGGPRLPGRVSCGCCGASQDSDQRIAEWLGVEG